MSVTKQEQEEFDNMASSFNDMMDGMDAETLEQLKLSTYCYRILVSVYYLDTVDPVIISQDIYEGYNGAIPLTNIENIVAEYLPIVINEFDTFDKDGDMTEEAIEVAVAHNEFLGLGKVKRPVVLH